MNPAQTTKNLIFLIAVLIQLYFQKHNILVCGLRLLALPLASVPYRGPASE